MYCIKNKKPNVKIRGTSLLPFSAESKITIRAISKISSVARLSKKPRETFFFWGGSRFSSVGFGGGGADFSSNGLAYLL